MRSRFIRRFLTLTAIVLIKTETGKAFAASEAIEKIDGVDMIHVVTGPYDLIAYVNYNTISLRGLIETISGTDGVSSTETCISIQ